MMEAVVNQRIDTHLVQQVNRMRSNGGNSASKYVDPAVDSPTTVSNKRPRYFKRLKLDYPQADTNKASRKFVKAMKTLDVSCLLVIFILEKR